jgi:hypothetical protein
MSAKILELRTMHVELQQGFQAVCQLAQTNVLVAQNSVRENEMHEVLRFMNVVTEILDGMPNTGSRVISVLRACEGMLAYNMAQHNRHGLIIYSTKPASCRHLYCTCSKKLPDFGQANFQKHERFLSPPWSFDSCFAYICESISGQSWSLWYC